MQGRLDPNLADQDAKAHKTGRKWQEVDTCVGGSPPKVLLRSAKNSRRLTSDHLCLTFSTALLVVLLLPSTKGPRMETSPGADRLAETSASRAQAIHLAECTQASDSAGKKCSAMEYVKMSDARFWQRCSSVRRDIVASQGMVHDKRVLCGPLVASKWRLNLIVNSSACGIIAVKYSAALNI